MSVSNEYCVPAVVSKISVKFKRQDVSHFVYVSATRIEKILNGNIINIPLSYIVYTLYIQEMHGQCFTV